MNRLHVIPQPNRVLFTGGVFAVPHGGSVLDFASHHPEPSLGPEEYRLHVTREGAALSASSPKGFFYGERTLLQMEQSYRGRLPCVKIQDAPRFSYRGFMLDSARHFWTVEQVKQMIDAAALFKFNTFHWHLSDDQGWRVEIDEYPELVETGSVRRLSTFGKVRDERDYRGHYTKEDIREIVAYCAQRFMDVIPEIDMPGHVSAALAAFPELSCTGRHIEVQHAQGIFKDILCAGKEESFTFAQTVLTEIMELFPCEYIHIGGDEAPKTRWKSCPHCQNRLQAEGLKNMEELQGYFTNRVAAFLFQHGRVPVVWNESVKSGNLDPRIIVTHWMDHKPVTDSSRWAQQGGRIINGDFSHYYTDYEYARTPLKKTYAYNPVPRGLSGRQLNHLLGVEALIWTEHVRDMKRMGYLTYPRFAAVAETGWTRPDGRNEKAFEESFERISPLLKAIGIYPAPPGQWNPLKRIDWGEAENMLFTFAQSVKRAIYQK